MRSCCSNVLESSGSVGAPTTPCALRGASDKQLYTYLTARTSRGTRRYAGGLHASKPRNLGCQTSYASPGLTPAAPPPTSCRKPTTMFPNASSRERLRCFEVVTHP